MKRIQKDDPSGSPIAETPDEKADADSETLLKRHVQGVSFPRSGHHLLVTFLSRYYGSRFDYCEYYNHCQQVPCTNPANNLQKSHDFDLKLPTDGNCDYLLQYRHPLYAVTSNYTLHLRALVAQGVKGVQVADGKEPVRFWHDFAVRDLDRWKAWMRKWILGNDNPRVWTLAYEDVVHRPAEMLGAAAEYFCPSHSADRKRVNSLVEELRVSEKRQLTEFRHFDVEFFRDLEDRAREEIEAVGLPLVMSSDLPIPAVPRRQAAD